MVLNRLNASSRVAGSVPAVPLSWSVSVCGIRLPGFSEHLPPLQLLSSLV